MKIKTGFMDISMCLICPYNSYQKIIVLNKYLSYTDLGYNILGLQISECQAWKVKINYFGLRNRPDSRKNKYNSNRGSGQPILIGIKILLIRLIILILVNKCTSIPTGQNYFIEVCYVANLCLLGLLTRSVFFFPFFYYINLIVRHEIEDLKHYCH